MSVMVVLEGRTQECQGRAQCQSWWCWRGAPRSVRVGVSVSHGGVEGAHPGVSG